MLQRPPDAIFEGLLVQNGEVSSNADATFHVDQPGNARNDVRRACRFVRQEVPGGSLTIDAGPLCLVRVIGAPTGDLVVDVQSRARGNDEESTREQLDKWTVAFTDDRLTVAHPSPMNTAVKLECMITVSCPADSTVVVNGTYVAVEIRQMGGSVQVETSHGRTVLLNNTGALRARCTSGGWIAYRGSTGSVELEADLGLELMVDAAQFRGHLRGLASGPVRLVLQSHFESVIEATVCSGSTVHCDHPALPTPTVSRTGNITYRYGTGEPSLVVRSKTEDLLLSQ